MNTLFESGSETQVQREGGPPRRRWRGVWTGAAVVLAVAGVVLGITAVVKLSTERSQLQGVLHATESRVTKLEARARILDGEITKAKGEANAATIQLDATQQELERARAAARKVNKEQSRRLAALDDEIDQTQSGVARQDSALQKTNAQLQSAIGDLGHHGDLIASTRDELQQLKLTSERTYVDFDITKSKAPERVGPVAIRLEKTDTKHNRFTVVLTVDDQQIERKDQTLFEPIQFCRRGSHQVNEIVIYRLRRNEVAGYLSEPHEAGGAGAAGASS